MTEIDYTNAENEIYDILKTGWVTTYVKLPLFDIVKKVPEPNAGHCMILCEPGKSQNKIGIGAVAAFIQVHNFQIFIYEASERELNYAISQMMGKLALANKTNKVYLVTHVDTDVEKIICEGIIIGTREYFYNLT